MTRRTDGLLMFSGGLDSIVAGHLLKSQGLSITALHFVLPFYSGLGDSHERIRDFAAVLGIPLIIEEEGGEFMEMVRSPQFGFGKNANPCIDCRIHRLLRARQIMEESGALFIATGEVVGQRPKSQRLETLGLIEKCSGLTGRLLRPLSARLLEPTAAEKSGIIDRSRLLAIDGRGRKEQIEYADRFNLPHPSPAGGCCLTNIHTADRYLAMAQRFPEFTLEDFRLIAWGRHFVIGDRCQLVVARDSEENDVLERIVSGEDLVFDLADVPGPMGIGRGRFSNDDILTAAAFVARYSRARNDAAVNVRVYGGTCESRVVTVSPADPALCEACILR